jgi:tetratricopeptide (TPR) repeat protein
MSSHNEHVVPVAPTDDYYNLGSFTRVISTESWQAQVWFNRGLIWSYSFNHDEACKCFEQAIAHDGMCAMAYWGLAYAAGPNYNKSWHLFDPSDLQQSMKRCHNAARKAQELVRTGQATVTSIEAVLIHAIQARFPVDHPVEDFSVLDKEYASAMEKVYDQYGDEDLDVVTLYADALMHTALRKLFYEQSGLPIEDSPVYQVQRVFDRGLQHMDANRHPGILHLFIHFLERSATPAAALPAADKLRNLVPDAGHMHHMPTHLDVLVGDYRRSIDSNTAAVRADEKYLAREGAKDFYSFYRLHNYHSLIYAAMLAGQSKVAMKALNDMEASIADDVLRVKSPPLADWMEFFKAVRVHVYIRFGMWKEIINLPLPLDQDLYCVTTVMTHYGKGIAHAAMGNITEAEQERELYHAAAKRVPPTRKDFPNLIVDVLKVATAMLDGEIQYRRGNFTSAFEYLREAIRHDDSLLYTEPWGWMLPTRHAYAALSLEQGHRR